MKTMKSMLCLLLALLLALSCVATVWADDDALTAGEAKAMLLAAADDYENPAADVIDLLAQYDGETLDAEAPISYLQALVMLNRAFGGTPQPSAGNAIMCLPAMDTTGVPEWAAEELADLLSAGIVDGDPAAETISREELEWLIRREYALHAGNEKDDFYAAMNRDTLDTLVLLPGRALTGTLYALSDEAMANLSYILAEVCAMEDVEPGSKEQKIRDFYATICDSEGREAAGFDALLPYTEAIDAALSIPELLQVQAMLLQELCVAPYLGFGISTNPQDSTEYMLSFNTVSAGMTQEFYAMPDAGQQEAYLTYLTRMLMLLGESEETARAEAEGFLALETQLSAAEMTAEESASVLNRVNVVSFEELQGWLPGLDLEQLLTDCGLVKEDAVLVGDPDLVKAFAGIFTEENLPAFRTAGKLTVLSAYAGCFTHEVIEISSDFSQAFYGVSGMYSDEEIAIMNITNLLGTYVSRLYVENCFSPEAKAEAEQLIQDILAVYRERIQNLTWMSEETKAMALRKLDTMVVKVGYPDQWPDRLDSVEILGVEEGGTFFENVVAIMQAQRAEGLSHQGQKVDRTEWAIAPTTVNACYEAEENSITFPAAILQSPMFSVDASYEENLGGIGYVMAHEITHAFDNNGAHYDENGNMTDWWTEEDYAAFDALCGRMIAFYDGQEGIPGLKANGTLTVSENVADNGALQCITQIIREKDGDMQVLFESVARTWASIGYREALEYYAQFDVHSADKLRVNRVLQNVDDFYTAFAITEGDGMFVPEAERVVIW